ncbi:MAG: sulfite exporter TauE/SafE family protein [Flavobacteriales bacterium]|nr:sulfite exporter TauE/SafE family protein [Flavobacteriales bacterium]MBK6943663.1 sulfite exporter TauE/SafE family protein [Flavobacteriales bacterium]MBK7296919.1 sulfite exporter TauE/SafE family protein [Flavobacteriales bacterium]MBK9535804.1 sulfite exporter TauE/SafE family protein [Flavobacteriales bacterium]MBP9138717.1 sulfite exporter TauE/SafE family protein [Flavobacteriales bacterium]
MEIVGYLGALVMGITLGLFGGGGSILTVPILVYLFGQDPLTATGLSLFIVGATSAVGSFAHHRQENIHWGTALLFGASSIISVYATRHWLMPALPDPLFLIGDIAVGKGTAILVLFAILMLGASLSMIRKPAAQNNSVEHTPSPLALLIIGLLSGVITGILGAGGGFLIVPALVLLAGLDMKKAVGTSLFLITVNAFIGFMGDPDIHIKEQYAILLPLVAIAILGTVLGSRMSKQVDGKKLRPIFGWFVLAMGIMIMVKELWMIK